MVFNFAAHIRKGIIAAKGAPNTLTIDRIRIKAVDIMRKPATDRLRAGNRTKKLLAKAVAIMAITARKLPKIMDQPYMKDALCPNASSM